MNGVLSLDDFSSSGNDSSTDSETTSGDDDSLKAVCEEIGADYDHASEYVDVHGSKDDLVDFARELQDDDELWAVQEEYRQGNDIHRIVRNYLRGHELEFTAYTQGSGDNPGFYGDTDDPEPGTYNHVQDKSREMGGNLAMYRALFPEPVTEHWDDDAVCWHEFDSLQYSSDRSEQTDSHIYVPASFVEEYNDFTIEVAGEQKPRPPANEELGVANDGGSSGSNLPFDPTEFTIAELEDELESVDYDVDQLEVALEAEKSKNPRKGAKRVLRDEIDAMEESDTSGAEQAGEMHGKGEATDISPEKIKELTEQGWTKEEIIELYG